ncbi:MAG: pre-peptidase, partial [Gemmataceae bacterium]
IPRTGEYVIQIRDSKYDGDPRWTYAMIVTQRPYVSHVYPMAGNPGQVVQVEPVGSAKSAMDRVPLTAPDTPGIHQVPLTVGKDQTYPIAFIVSELPQVLEQEPNDTPAQAQRVTIPCGINGRIGVNRDLDHFVFAAKKGAAIRFEVKARRFGTSLQSSLDSVLDVMNAKGTVVATNDDLVGKDAGLVFTPPADGDYILRIRDLNSKGGDTAVYYIEAEPTRPDFAVKCDPDKAMIGPGSSMAWFAQVTRVGGFTGPVTIEVHGLPQGVTASPLTISPTMTQGVIVVTAAADAPLDATNVRIVARGTVQHADGRAEVLERPVTSMQEIYFPGGGRGQFDVNMQSVAVTEPSDILHVEVSPKIISMKPGEEVKIDVTVQRRPDYDKSISLDIPLKHLNRVYADPLPPGVTIVPGKSKTLLGAASQGHIVLKAAPNAAPIENVPISVMCHVSINFVVKVSYASAPILVSVRK